MTTGVFCAIFQIMDNPRTTNLHISTVLEHSVSGFFALEYPREKRVHIMYSRNIVLHLSQFLDRIITGKSSSRNTDIKKDLMSLNKVKFKYLETPYSPGQTFETDSTSNRITQYYWQVHYTNLGYTFYTSYKPVTMIPRISVNSDGWVDVELVNKAHKGFKVKSFELTRQAEEFVANIVDPNLKIGRIDLIFKEDSRNNS